MKHFIFVIFILFHVSYAFSQVNIKIEKKEFQTEDKVNFKDAWEQLKVGDDLYELGPPSYRDALPFFLKAYDYNPNHSVLNYKIGVCYLYSSNKSFAIPYLEKAKELDNDLITDLQNMLGVAYQFNLQFEKAIEAFENYRTRLSPSELKFAEEEIDKHIFECNVGIEIVQKPLKVFIDNVGSVINSEYPEYSPIISTDESVMLFTTRRNNSTGGEIDPNDNFYYEDIFISYNDGKEWSNPEQISENINTKWHEATVSISPDGQTFIIYDGKKNGGDLFVCKLEGKNWSKPKPLSRDINTDYHESSACFSPDGKYLYFVSDKEEDSFGGHDIYRATLDERGEWGNPQNLGAVINTAYEEESIFLHPDGKTMFFSSTGHRTMGGYDIFRTTLDETGNWTAPENIGFPINTQDNDLFFTMTGDGRHAYFSSSKEGGFGYQDIYRITFITEKPLMLSNEDNLLAYSDKPILENVIEEEIIIEGMDLTVLKGIIYDSITKQPLLAEIEIIDNQTGIKISTFNSNSVTGRYLIPLPAGKNYGIAVKSPTYLFHSENFDIPFRSGYNEIIKDVPLLKVVPGSRIVLRNVFFDTDKYFLRPESKSELNRLVDLLNEYPTMKIEVSGHTDIRGSLEHNITLSRNRANSVVTYLIEKGINKERLVFEGYAFNQPIATNDTEEGRQLNRRVEFKILSL